MTLRGSEQSLLHNPIKVGPKGARPDLVSYFADEDKGRKRRRSGFLKPLFARTKFMIYIGALVLSATCWLALDALNIDETLDAQFVQSGGAQFAKSNNAQSVQSNQVDQIIAPFGSSVDFDLKRLTSVNEGLEQSSPFEIPASQILNMLATSETENVLVSPDLKFYATSNNENFRACPSDVNAFVALSGGNSSCFIIKIKRQRNKSTSHGSREL